MTIHYTDLPEDRSANPLAEDWSYYRSQAGKLLADGHEGRWVLIKDQRIVGIFHTEQAAYDTALAQFLMQPVLIHQVRTHEPVLRGPLFFRLCRS